MKNNFQVVVSLLHLQSRQIADGDARAMFLDCEGRIRSMSLVHEKLYRSDNLARIDFGEYVRDLAGEIRHLYGRHSPSPALRISVDPVELEVTQAVPCGLIVSELLSNAYKHAFPADTPGREIRVSLRCAGDERVECAVCDNGVGIPEGLTCAQPHRSAGAWCACSRRTSWEGPSALTAAREPRWLCASRLRPEGLLPPDNGDPREGRLLQAQGMCPDSDSPSYNSETSDRICGLIFAATALNNPELHR